MIDNPWIILRVERATIRTSIWAVREPAPRSFEPRRTLDLLKAWGFPTERQAANQAKKLGYIQTSFGRLDRLVPIDPDVFYVVSRIEASEIRRPRRGPRPARDRDQTLFAFAWEPARA